MMSKAFTKTRDIFLTKEKIQIAARNAILVLAFSTLTGISSRFKIDIGPVPITMQTLVVFLSVPLLGKKLAIMSQIGYLIGGLFGIPWFSRGGGLGYLLSPSFGYIIGFVMASYLIGLLFESRKEGGFLFALSVITAANLLIYIPGLLWLARFIGFSNVLVVGFYPFLPGDIIKILSASLFFSLIKKQRIKESR